jgi:hypothetical protein
MSYVQCIGRSRREWKQCGAGSPSRILDSRKHVNGVRMAQATTCSASGSLTFSVGFGWYGIRLP